jgi:hypothetical protein
MVRKRAAFVGLVALLGLQAAQACEITRTAWGLRLTDCRLDEMYKGRYEVSIDRHPDWTVGPLKLPNLHPADINEVVVGASVNLSADIENTGRWNAPAFEVAVIGTVTDPLNGGAAVSTTPFPPIAIPSLAVGATVTGSAGAVSLPNRNQDWDVCTVVVVDPPTKARASGNVLESNEADNQRDGCCRVYGPNPDLNGPPAC